MAESALEVDFGHPSEWRGAIPISAEEREALDKMLAYVGGALPYAIVMKGGGVN
jgi:hypothetical protein